jgi:DNA-binding NtrC family response regulator
LQGILGIGSCWATADHKSRSQFPSSDDLHRKLLALRGRWRETYTLEDVMMGESPEAIRLRRQVRLASGCRENVLLQGPAGSGKERIARAIHFARPESADASLIPLDCALLDAELLHTTVTAFLKRCAALETAAVPTLLLLDIDRLDVHGQGELLGILSIHELEIRTIATTRAELADSNTDFVFRHDLAAMLSTLLISIPPLASRPSDIPIMAQQCVEKCNVDSRIARQGFVREALERMMIYGWPGDMEEFSQVVSEAHKRAEGAWIQPKDLPRLLQGGELDLGTPTLVRELIIAKALAELESSLLQRAMRIAKGNKSKAARLVGMSRPKLLRRLEHFGLIQADGQNEPQ